jgi:hypothetical protein
MLTLNPPVRARQQAQAEAAGETDATPAAAAADAAAATTGGRLLAAWRQSVLAVRARAINPEDRFDTCTQDLFCIWLDPFSHFDFATVPCLLLACIL